MERKHASREPAEVSNEGGERFAQNQKEVLELCKRHFSGATEPA